MEKELSRKLEEAKHEDGDAEAGADADGVKGKIEESQAEQDEESSTSKPEEDSATYAEKVKEGSVEG